MAKRQLICLAICHIVIWVTVFVKVKQKQNKQKKTRKHFKTRSITGIFIKYGSTLISKLTLHVFSGSAVVWFASFARFI
jgi:glycopeptide antibiotics resistance protein